MRIEKNGLVYEGAILGFLCASWVMLQRVRIKGKENLRRLPLPLIFTVTHDSYFEVPSLSRIYRAIIPRPVFTVMAKQDFMSGRYLSTNYFEKNRWMNKALGMVDKSGIPMAFFKKLNLISIPRPFAETLERIGDEVKREIAGQVDQFRKRIREGFSTLVFPEGTTWGYGGLKKIRSAVHQLVSNAFEQYDIRVYILPINVKVDRLVQGWKDVFINVGKPQFVFGPREDFNRRLHSMLEDLHTITFSQVGAYYLKRISMLSKEAQVGSRLTRKALLASLESAVERITLRVQDGILPALDERLTETSFLSEKASKFMNYCAKKSYLLEGASKAGERAYLLNPDRILAEYPVRLFRKHNPLAFHANELISLGEEKIEPLFDWSVPKGGV